MSTKVCYKYSLIKEHAVNINSLTFQIYGEVSLLFNPILKQILLLSAENWLAHSGLDGHQIRHM